MFHLSDVFGDYCWEIDKKYRLVSILSKEPGKLTSILTVAGSANEFTELCQLCHQEKFYAIS